MALSYATFDREPLEIGMSWIPTLGPKDKDVIFFDHLELELVFLSENHIKSVNVG